MRYIIENLLYSFAQGIRITEAENTEVYPLLYSTEQSFARTDVSASDSRRMEGEETGPFALAAAAERGNGKLVYYTTPCVFSKTILAQFLQSEMSLPAGNRTLFTRSIRYLTGQENAVSIPPKSMTGGQLLITAGAAARFGIFALLVVPALVLIPGFIVWFRRRRR